MFADILITSLINGSTYALLAIGFSLIFGVARIVNIAHTAFYMVAAFCIFFVTHHLGFHPIVGMLIAVPVVTLLGMVTYWIFIAPIREHEAAVLIGTIALAIAFSGHGHLLDIYRPYQGARGRRINWYHRPGHSPAGDHAAYFFRRLPQCAPIGTGIFYDYRCQSLLSATDYVYSRPGHSWPPEAPVNEDQAGSGYPINGPGPGGGQPHGDE